MKPNPKARRRHRETVDVRMELATLATFRCRVSVYCAINEAMMAGDANAGHGTMHPADRALIDSLKGIELDLPARLSGSRDDFTIELPRRKR